jgi:N-acetylglucosamine kinase-like BadF-type ATPase
LIIIIITLIKIDPMILIADCGSTKCEWCVLTDSENKRILTQGISPYFLTEQQICRLLETELIPQLREHPVARQVFYYGTGCTGPITVGVVTNALRELFPKATIFVTYDLVAAAHALCGNEKGIACILGTGCNSGYYNGKDIERNSPGLGYILGDEGSGAHLGKMIIRKYMYGDFDKEMKKRFEQRFAISEQELLHNVYTLPLANRYIGSFSIFLSENRGHPLVEEILLEGLGDFFRVHISSYSQYKEVPVHFTGSIAWGYSDVLQQLGSTYGVEIGKIIKEPMDGLLDYYSEVKNSDLLSRQ